MTLLSKLYQALKSFDNIETASAVISENAGIRRRIITLNQEQLYVYGVNRDGEQLQTYRANNPDVYAARTINIKREKRQPYDRVTLNDTGEFYRSMTITVEEDELVFYGNTKKANGDISDNLDIRGIFGLTKLSKTKLRKNLHATMILYYKSKIFNIR